MIPTSKIAQRGIWCLETVWFDTASTASVKPMLELINALYGTPYVHRNAVSREEFFYFLDAWLSSDKHGGGLRERYPILILAYHGNQGTICLKDDNTVDLDDDESWDESVVSLDEIQEVIDGRGNNRIIHFSSCSTLNVRHDDINQFIDTTGVSAISGYTKEVEWTHSLVLDLLFLEAIQEWKNVKLTPGLMSDAYYNFRRTAEELDELPDEEGWLPTVEMIERLGFNLRVRSVPAG